MMRLISYLVVAAICGLSACAISPRYTAEDELRLLQAKLATVTIEDGIDEHEANIIAQNYFFRFAPACGVASDVTDAGEEWISQGMIGAVPLHSEPIRIEKLTGRTKWADGPTMGDPRTIWTE